MLLILCTVLMGFYMLYFYGGDKVVVLKCLKLHIFFIVAPKPVSSPHCQGSDFPRFDRASSSTFTSPLGDEFHGARRDLRLHARQYQARPLDGSSTSSSIPGMQHDFMGSPEWFIEANRGYDHQYKKTGGNMRFWQGDYMGHESTATAGTHSFTGRYIKPIYTREIKSQRT